MVNPTFRLEAGRRDAKCADGMASRRTLEKAKAVWSRNVLNYAAELILVPGGTWFHRRVKAS
jgi:hypothetical protein